MHRIDSVNAVPNLHGAGKAGFGAGDPTTGQKATYLSPDWCNAIQEEIAAVIELAGGALSKNSNGQLAAKIQALIAAGDAPAATTETAGIVRMATAEEVAEKTEPNAAVSPADLAELTNDIQGVAVRTTALEARLGYTVLYPGGTAAAPATISANQRIVIDNPFGAAPCIVLAQIYVGEQWVWSGHVTSNDSFYFTFASILGNQIVVQTGLNQIGRRGPVGGSPFATPDYVATAPYRVLVWKLAGA